MSMTREELIFLLTQAAELEHLLSCQYLFAAFSLKRDASEGLTEEELNHVKDWAQTFLLVAREEMSHLGLVCNLLTAIGGAPHFARPNFPQPPKYYPFPMELRPFDETVIKRFVCIERPEHISSKDAFCEELMVPAPPGHAQPQRLTAALRGQLSPYPVHFDTVGSLYHKIKAGFRNFPGGDAALFIGPSQVQVDYQQLSLYIVRDGAVHPGLFDVTLTAVTDSASALRVIDTIIEQGEGGPGPAIDEPSHYKRFLTILEELQRLEREAQGQGRSFQPARDLAHNPCLYHHQDAPGSTLVTHPQTREVLDVCNSAYEILLLLLSRLYAYTDETDQEIAGLSYIVLPFMVAVFRPLCELLTAMPASAHDPAGRRAGPSFEVANTLAFLPHKQSAWRLLLERMRLTSARCTELSRQDDMPKRLADVGDTLRFMAGKFESYLQP